MKQLEQTIEKLSDEVESRNSISYTVGYLEKAESIIDKTPRRYPDLITLYPEFEDRSLLSLLIRLQELVPDSAAHIDNAYPLLSNIANDSRDLSVSLKQHGKDYLIKNYNLDEEIESLYMSMIDAYTSLLEIHYYLEDRV